MHLRVLKNIFFSLALDHSSVLVWLRLCFALISKRSTESSFQTVLLVDLLFSVFKSQVKSYKYFLPSFWHFRPSWYGFFFVRC